MFNEENMQFHLQAGKDTLDRASDKKHFCTSDVFLVGLHSLYEKSDVLALCLKVLSSLSLCRFSLQSSWGHCTNASAEISLLIPGQALCDPLGRRLDSLLHC